MKINLGLVLLMLLLPVVAGAQIDTLAIRQLAEKNRLQEGFIYVIPISPENSAPWNSKAMANILCYGRVNRTWFQTRFWDGEKYVCEGESPSKYRNKLVSFYGRDILTHCFEDFNSGKIILYILRARDVVEILE